MKKARVFLKALLYPPKGILYIVPPVVFTALILIFVTERTESTAAYLIYGMSAYALVILLAAAPKMIGKAKVIVINSRPVQAVSSTQLGKRYLHDIIFRGRIGIYQGMAANFAYALFWGVSGIQYVSSWFVSMAAYYFTLGAIRTYLAIGYHQRAGDVRYEYRCCRRTAWSLFLLNIPMGGMMVLMVRTNAGFSYPGYVIYFSALYTFYMMIFSAVNLAKFRKLGSPILSAAKVVNFISAMMSILGLQTAMISRFSVNGETYRTLMNAVTGGFVFGTVVVLAVYMLVHTITIRKKLDLYEQI